MDELRDKLKHELTELYNEGVRILIAEVDKNTDPKASKKDDAGTAVVVLLPTNSRANPEVPKKDDAGTVRALPLHAAYQSWYSRTFQWSGN